MKRFIFSALLTTFLLALTLPASAQQAKKNVLFLNSYENGYSWSDEILDGVRQVFMESNLPVDLQIEYMDTKRYHLEDIRDVLKSYYLQKYSSKSFDLIICSDTNAFNFILETRYQLFPGVPVVFCGVNDFRSEWIQGHEDITGVVERPDIAANIHLARKLNPTTRKVIVIGDESVTSKAIINQVIAAEPEFAGKISFEYWNVVTMQDILSRVRNLSSDTVIFFTPFYKGANGQLFTAQEVLNAISTHSNTMIFSSWRFLLGSGTIGGKLLSGTGTGQVAAKMGLQILRGTPIAELPVLTQVPDPYVFDWNALQRFQISKDSLPEDSLFINEPEAFYRINPQLFWTGLVFMLSLSIILLFLVMAIGQRRKVEATIKTQLAFQEILMDTIPMLVSWKDTKHKYLGVNKLFAEFFGMPIDGHLSPSTEYPPDIALPAIVNQWDREVTRTGRSIRGRTFSVIGRDGSTVWFEVSKVPLYGVRGEVIGTLSTAEDITHKVELKQQLLQSQKMEAIGTLAGGIAHDFNNILTSIINSCELAMLDIDEDTQTGEDISRALVAAHRGGRVVKQILAFSRPSQEDFKHTDVAAVVREAMDLLRSSLPRTIEVESHIEPAGKVWANSDQLHQVIMNLCTNAFHSLREKGGKLAVTLREDDVDEETAQLAVITPGRHLRLTVTDNGPGIPDEIAGKIFDPFFTTKGTSEGTGLGLAVVHGIIKAHSGGIRVSSRPHHHTTFDIYLPCRTDETSQTVGPVLIESKGTERILFVEDDPDQLETVPRLLGDLGYRTEALSSASAALKRIRQEPNAFDLVVTDYDMPEMDGLAFSKALAVVAPKLPVIMVSGRRDATERAAMVPTIRQMVIKPYNRSVLAAAIRSALDDTSTKS